MIWCMVALMAVLVVILAGQAIMMTSLRMRVSEAEDIVSDLMEMTRGISDSRRPYVASRLRIYSSRWGRVVKEREWK